MVATMKNIMGTTMQTYSLSIISALYADLFMPSIESIKSNPTLTQSWNYSYKLAGEVCKRAGISETGVVRLIVAFLLFAILFPISMAQITSATTTSWNPAVATVFSVLTPILVALAAALGFFAVVESRGGL